MTDSTHPHCPSRRLVLCCVIALAALLLTLTTARAEFAANEAELEARAASFRTAVEYLADPAREGRGAGTRGLAEARDYLVERFGQIGLRAAFGEKYTQELTIKLGVEAKEQKLAISGGGGEAVEPKGGVDFNALGFSGSGEFRGPVVFIGYGIVNEEQKYDSFDGGAEVKGKVAIAYRYEPQDEEGQSLWTKESRRAGTWSNHSNLTEKAKRAAETGAVALLLVNPPSQEDGSLRSTTRTAFGDDAAIPTFHVRASVLRGILKRAGHDDPDQTMRDMQANADAGKDAPVALTGVTIGGNVELERPQTKIQNVAGVLPGSGALAKQYVVIGAHYDHIGYGEIGSRKPTDEPTIHPGADDNASGTAGLVLLAEYFASHFKSLNGEAAPRRSILFAAFSGEERGLLGSKHMVKNIEELGIKTEDIAVMLNMDMVGRVKEGKLFAFGADSGDRFKAVLETAAEGSGLNMQADGSGSGASDHASFYMVSIPAVHFFTGSHPDYHAPTDTAEKINAADAVRVLNVIARAAETLATEPTRLAFQKSESNPHAGAAFARGGPVLGIMPDYATTDGEQGCGLDGVTPGGPAEAAGLKGGDLIVGWNGEKLNNVRHLMQFLGNSKPGENVKLKVKRGEEIVELDVELGRR